MRHKLLRHFSLNFDCLLNCKGAGKLMGFLFLLFLLPLISSYSEKTGYISATEGHVSSPVVVRALRFSPTVEECGGG